MASQVATLANFYLTTWEEWHTGVRRAIHPSENRDADNRVQTLFLSAFSGPVEGILMIIVIFAITGLYGKATRLARPGLI